ncbi:hypothetical protein [Bacillus velezensis]|uniref:hypothetical protein n=1 Tax=Bacillus velezensis TaxID=492670 RepID=UPI0024AFDABC|nr:hypothetical protein [Bacillus velezensis]WHM14858.1 hypothetical protein QLX65_07120 [Bacillus velezensis]
MAKLDGVKTLDMVNGEITKVAYGGAEYERVEGRAKEFGSVGDLVLNDRNHGDLTVGAFYEIVIDEDYGWETVRDDVGDGHISALYDSGSVLFRKVSASTGPSLEDRVSSAEGEIESLKSDVAALKGEPEYKRIDADEAQEGDYVKFDEAPRRYLTAGKYYEIDCVDSSGYPWIIDDEGDDFDTSVLHDDEFELYRKVSAASVEVEPKPERLKVGDYARVVENLRVHCAEIGEIVLVKIDDESVVPYKCEKLNGERGGWFYESELVRATDEEVAEAKDAAEFAKFKEGVKVRLRSGGGEFPLNGYENGKVYEISYAHLQRNRIGIIGGEITMGFATPDQLEILSEEEAAEHKKWAEIGREVSEYKVGDIVRVIDTGCSNLSVGDIGPISEIDEGCAQVSARNLTEVNWVSFKRIELIMPVEARFDR